MNLCPVYILLLTYLNGAVDARVGNVNTLYNSDEDSGRRNNDRHALIGTRERVMYDIDEKVKKNNIPSKSKYDRVEETDHKFYRGGEKASPPSSENCPCFTAEMLVDISDEGIDDDKSCHAYSYIDKRYDSSWVLHLNQAYTVWGNENNACSYKGKRRNISFKSAQICRQLIVDRCAELTLTKLPTLSPTVSPTATPSVAPTASATVPPTVPPTVSPGPTTNGPTTGGPTTGGPTTYGLTTHPSTATGRPTTNGPTTGGPTTNGPTTGGPTTQPPTTQGPTTHGPTTQKPRTPSPTTPLPTSPAPTTPAPTTPAPTTPAPMTPTKSPISLTKLPSANN